MLRILTSNNKPKAVGLLSTKSLILSHFNVSESILVAALDHVEKTNYKLMYL